MFDCSEMEILDVSESRNTTLMLALGNFYLGYGARATSMLAMGQAQLVSWLWDKSNFYVARKDH